MLTLVKGTTTRGYTIASNILKNKHNLIMSQPLEKALEKVKLNPNTVFQKTIFSR